jgi:hypothetical protein
MNGYFDQCIYEKTIVPELFHMADQSLQQLQNNQDIPSGPGIFWNEPSLLEGCDTENYKPCFGMKQSGEIRLRMPRKEAGLSLFRNG